MTADAMLVAGDSRYAVVAKRQSLTHERRRTVSNPPRYYVSDEVSPSIKVSACLIDPLLKTHSNTNKQK